MVDKLHVADLTKIARKLAELSLTRNQYLPDYGFTEKDILEVASQELNESTSMLDIDQVKSALHIMNYVVKGQPTVNAYSLLNEPPKNQKIFVSYRRSQSALLALYIHTRLLLAGADAFLDIRNIKSGDNWHAELEKQIRVSDYFIAILGKVTLASKNVCKELKWAIHGDVPIIPIIHDGFDFSNYDSTWEITKSEWSRIQLSNGKDITDDKDINNIRSAIEFVLITMGYTVI